MPLGPDPHPDPRPTRTGAPPGQALRIRGQVQGVGFRPFVWQIARRFGLCGQVLNDPEGVLIELTAPAPPGFLEALAAEAPPLARIDAIAAIPLAPAPRATDFTIAPSRGAGAETRVTPDAATCPACRAEIAAPGRRQGYAFTNCTHCGPRFSIVTALPYDRARSTMAGFALCPACAAEYANPADRRFHAQPICCPACGPRLWYESLAGEAPSSETPPETPPACGPGDSAALAQAAAALAQGAILAIKGLGGFHLACDARNLDAIARLRARKRRPTKPLAVMGDLAMLARLAEIDTASQALLADPAAPIVLVPLLPGADPALAQALAPGLDRLGVMLPYTPLHQLLIAAMGGALVMTSGNLSGEPQVIDNTEARAKLAGFVDGFLLHDRPIARRLDDGVERATPPLVLRRARGRVPGTLPLPPGFGEAPQVLAFGGQMKAAICLTKGGQALLSHHLGDLDDARTTEEYHAALGDYAGLFDHRPGLLACDLHPGYRASQIAADQAARLGLPLIGVQHHHAHLAACLAEALWPRDGGPVAAIVLDGLGLGLDGSLWGGELLLGDYAGFTRIAHLAPAPLPGGAAAQREPWRNALMRLDQAGLADLADQLFAGQPLALLRQAAAAGLNAPQSSAAGRLFDAFAALIAPPEQRLRAQSYEGEAAMRLEALARPAPPYPLAEAEGLIDPAPLFAMAARDLARGRDPGAMAGAFHAGLAQAFARPARALVESGAARAVALSGGCLQNAWLLGALKAELAGLRVLEHRVIPAGDGGLALGQALVAAAQGPAGA